MANFKEIKTKIALKQNTYEYWTTGEGKEYIPLYGEVCLCEIFPEGYPYDSEGGETGKALTAPTVLFKVGTAKKNADGSWVTGTDKKFSELNWASALAADVYDWAKKSLEEFTAWVAKTPKTVTLKVNNVDTQYTIEEAIKLVRSEIAAGGESVAITIADESTTDKIKYIAKQGGTDIVEAIEINAGTGINIAIVDNVPTIKHQVAPTTGSTATATAETGEKSTFVTEVTIDGLGHVAGVKTAEIDIPDSPSITIVDKTNTDDDNTVYAVTNLEESGTLNHTITPTYTAIPTQKYVDEKIAATVAGAVDYLGVVNNTNELSAAAEEATHGDFVRVATAFDSYHIGDLLIYHKPEEAGTATWVVIHGEEGDIVEVEAGNGLTGGGSSGKVTLGIAEKGVTEGMLEQGVQDALGLARAAATDASNKAVVVLSEAQKYTDGKIEGLHAIATSGSIYDVEEHNVDDNGVTYFILDCNW